jgi:hypothetical protein
MPTVLQPRGCIRVTALALVPAAWLAACTEPVPPPAGEAAEVARAAAAEPYPELARVPPRPRLGYTVEQRREIVRGLIADREHTRYEGETLRHRLLGAAAPTPPAQPQLEAPAVAEPPPLIVEAAVLGESVRSESRSGSLSDFLDWLLQPAAGGDLTDAPPADAGFAPAPDQPVSPSPEPRSQASSEINAAAASKASSDAMPPARLFGSAEPVSAPPVPAAQPAPVEFALVGDSLPPQVQEQLQALVAAASDGPLVVVAQGNGPAQSLERARRVARELVALGFDPRRIDLRPSGPGHRVRVEPLKVATISAQADRPRVGHLQE